MFKPIHLAAAVALLAFGVASSAQAASIASGSWSGTPIASDENDTVPPYEPAGTYDFDLTGNTLTLTLASTGGDEVFNWQLLSGLTWNIDGNVALAAVSATAADLINPPTGGPIAVDENWAFKSNISSILFGSYGVGGAGDINFGEDTFGRMDQFCALNGDCPGGIAGQPNGTDYLITSNPGFTTPASTPQILGSATFVWTVSGDAFSITDVNPIFGTSGAPIPEPGSAVLFATGLLVAAGTIRRSQR